MYPIDFFYRASTRWPDRCALEDPILGEVSFAELRKRVDALAHAMQQIDPDEQSRVCICAGNHAGHVISLLATLAAGKTWVPLNARSTAAELARIIEAVKPTIVISDAHTNSLIHTSNHITRLQIGSPRSHDAFDLPSETAPKYVEDLIALHLGSKPAAIEAGREATQAIKFTGGTTGAPKGVMQPYRAWTAGIINQIHGWNLSPDDCFIVAAPVTHGTSTYILPILGVGGRLGFTESSGAPAVARAFRQRRGTISFMPPTLIYMLMSHVDVSPQDFVSMRLLVTGGAPMPIEKYDEAVRYFGQKIGSTYGQTEAPQIVTMIRPEELMDARNRGSAGRCTWLNDLAIMSPSGQVLPENQTGEIVVRGDLVMTGYWQLPDKTSETIKDGWLHTGDVGYLDNRGYLFLKDRIRDVIITGGFNVYPVDVEAALSKHPAVYECSVFGMPDEKWGEAVHAAIQLRAGHEAVAQVFITHVKALLGSVHTPKQIHFFEQLPRSSVGKVLKKDIKLQLQARYPS
jgi:fatty-acyl-CoA synthase